MGEVSQLQPKVRSSAFVVRASYSMIYLLFDLEHLTSVWCRRTSQQSKNRGRPKES